jgi:hypothetical protein
VDGREPPGCSGAVPAPFRALPDDRAQWQGAPAGPHRGWRGPMHEDAVTRVGKAGTTPREMRGVEIP